MSGKLKSMACSLVSTDSRDGVSLLLWRERNYFNFQNINKHAIRSRKWKFQNGSGDISVLSRLKDHLEEMLKSDEGVVCRHCRKRYSPTEYTQAIRCYVCGHITSVRKEQENTSSEPISTWEAKSGKRALLCGVTYNKEKFKLRGTIYDVSNMRDLLVDHFQFPSSSIRILAEAEGYHHPTKSNIQAALRWLVKDCQSGDSLVFYFSGHGLRQPDFDEDELDGFDETICPLDFRTAGMILDNELNETIVRPLQKGVILHAIVDTCHSGTILDLPRIYSPKEGKWIDNYPPFGAYKGASGGLAISFSACEDDQLAADTTAFSDTGKQMEGAMTCTFAKAVRENPKVTYGDLLASMKALMDARKAKCFSLRRLFKREIIQDALMSSSEEFDVNKQLML